MKHKEEKSNFQIWLGWLLQWMSDVVHRTRSPKEQKLTVVETIKSPDKQTVARSVLRNTPGAISTWYIGNKCCPHTRLIITLDNLYEIRTFLDYCSLPDDSTNIIRTHLICVQWVVKVGERRKRVYKFKGAWLADLQGKSPGVNAKAIAIIRFCVMEVVNLLPLQGIHWENRLDKYPWEESIIRKAKIIDENHNPHLKKINNPDILIE